MNLSKNTQYTSNLSSDESEGRGHRKRKQKRFADGKDVQLCAYCVVNLCPICTQTK
jgi:hypothetical protein